MWSRTITSGLPCHTGLRRHSEHRLTRTPSFSNLHFNLLLLRRVDCSTRISVRGRLGVQECVFPLRCPCPVKGEDTSRPEQWKNWTGPPRRCPDRCSVFFACAHSLRVLRKPIQ